MAQVNFINRYVWIYGMFFLSFIIFFITTRFENDDTTSSMEKNIKISLILLGIILFIIAFILMKYTNILFTYRLVKSIN